MSIRPAFTISIWDYWASVNRCECHLCRVENPGSGGRRRGWCSELDLELDCIVGVEHCLGVVAVILKGHGMWAGIWQWAGWCWVRNEPCACEMVMLGGSWSVVFAKKWGGGEEVPSMFMMLSKVLFWWVGMRSFGFLLSCMKASLFISGQPSFPRHTLITLNENFSFKPVPHPIICSFSWASNHWCCSSPIHLQRICFWETKVRIFCFSVVFSFGWTDWTLPGECL